MSAIKLKKKIAIIGCGPVGMLGSLLLEHLDMDYIVLEKYASPRSHPSAHWLSANSKAILSQIPNLNQQIDYNQQSFENFRYYRYMQSLFGHQLTLTDHFQPSIPQRLQRSKDIFGFTPNHIPQNLLLKIMYDKVKNKENLIFGTQVKDIQSSPHKANGKSIYTLIDSNNNPIVQAENIILCSGAGTSLRSRLPPPMSPIHMQGKQNLMNIINVHFTSKKLAEALKEQNQNAMLHFIYGKKIIGILVNHSIQKTGTFVLQIPNYEPFVDLMEVYSARQLINMIFQSDYDNVLNDLNVIHVGKWKLQGILADTMYKNGIFLAGDAAHAYPPAGGFGMNSGFQDIHELVHALFTVHKNKQANEKNIYTRYSSNRRSVNSQYLKKALENYQITKNISISLGYSPNILDYFKKGTLIGSLFSFLPKPNQNTMQNVRLKAMQMMYRRQFMDSPALNLFFDDFDNSIQKVSKIRKNLMEDIKNMRGQSPNFYVRQNQVSKQDIEKLVGKVEANNIKFYTKEDPKFANAQKLICSDGNYLIQ